MDRTTIYLEAELKRRLAEVARQRGESEAFILREALRTYLTQQAVVRIEPVGQSTDGGIAHRLDESLADLGFGRS